MWFLGEQVSWFGMFWWKMNLDSWFWPKSQSLTFQYTVKIDQLTGKFNCQSCVLGIFWTCWTCQDNSMGSLIPYVSLVCHWLGQTVKNCLCAVKTLKNDHFALLVIWSNFLWNCDPNLIKWSIWVHNVDVGQFSWDLTVNWPQLTFSPIQLISRSTVQLTGQNLESRLESWHG